MFWLWFFFFPRVFHCNGSVLTRFFPMCLVTFRYNKMQHLPRLYHHHKKKGVRLRPNDISTLTKNGKKNVHPKRWHHSTVLLCPSCVSPFLCAT